MSNISIRILIEKILIFFYKNIIILLCYNFYYLWKKLGNYTDNTKIIYKNKIKCLFKSFID